MSVGPYGSVQMCHGCSMYYSDVCCPRCDRERLIAWIEQQDREKAERRQQKVVIP